MSENNLQNNGQNANNSVQEAKEVAGIAKDFAAGNKAKAVKNAVKKVGKDIKSAIDNPEVLAKKALKHVAIAVVPALAIILIALLFFGALLEVAKIIKDKIVEFAGKIWGWINHIVEGIAYGDGIVVKDEEVDEFIEQLEQKGVSLVDLGFGADDEDMEDDEEYKNASEKEKAKKKAREYIKVFMEAALVTQTVWTDKTGMAGIAGGIKLVRQDALTGISTNLTRDDELEAGDYESYKLDDEGKVIINSKGGGQITIDPSAYDQYTIPIEYFVDLCLVTQNPKYVAAIAEGIKTGRMGSAISSSVSAGAINEDGYTQTITFDGIEYKEYKQNSSLWSEYPYGGIGTIGHDGCGPTSVAVVLSGFMGNITPDQIADRMDSTGSTTLSNALSEFNISNQIYGSPTSEDITRILASGHPIIVGLDNGVPSDGGTQFTGSPSGHISVILGIDGDNVYLSNVYNSTNMRTGWVPLDILMEKTSYIIDVTPPEECKGGKVNSLNNFLIIGDSRIEGIAPQLEQLGSNITVIGVGSSTPEEWVAVAENGSGVVRGRSVTLPEEVNGVCVMLGTNGIEQYSQMKKIMNGLHERYPDVKIFAANVYHVASQYSYGTIDATSFNKSIDKFNSKLKTFCIGQTIESGVTWGQTGDWAKYIDVTTDLYDENEFLKAEFSSGDGIHIQSSAGINTIVNNIKSAILGNQNTGLSIGYSGSWMVIGILDSCSIQKKDITYWITDEETNHTTESTITNKEQSRTTTYRLNAVNHLLFRMRQTYTTTSDETSETISGSSGNTAWRVTTTNETYGFTTPIEQDPVILCEAGDFFVEKSKKKYKVPYSKLKLRAYDSYKDGGEILFALMDANVENEFLKQLTKYVLYKMTGVDFGVTEWDFSTFSFSRISGANGEIGWHWTCLHENGAMWLYMHDVDTDYDKYYVKNYVSQDKTTYYMHGDGTANRSMNYGYGVCIFAWGNWMPHTFPNYGINIYDSQYHSFWTSTMPVEIVDQVSMEEWLYWKDNYVLPWVESAGIQLEEYQLDCLTDMCYQNSNYAREVINNYKIYGLSESLRSSCTAFNSWGTRADDRWALFSRGEYVCSGVNYVLNPEDFKGEDGENSSTSSGETNTPTTSNTATGPNGYIHPCPTACITNYPGSHAGYDFAASQGAPVYAATSGTIYYYQYYDSITGKLVSYGNWCQQQADDGHTIIYAHLRDFYGIDLRIPYTKSTGYPSSYNSNTRLIGLGSKTVKKGDLIGYVGTTGNSTGPHLHFEIRGISNSSYAYKQYIPSPN